MEKLTKEDREHIEKALEDFKQGRIVPSEEIRKYLESWGFSLLSEKMGDVISFPATFSPSGGGERQLSTIYEFLV